MALWPFLLFGCAVSLQHLPKRCLFSGVVSKGRPVDSAFPTLTSLEICNGLWRPETMS